MYQADFFRVAAWFVVLLCCCHFADRPMRVNADEISKGLSAEDLALLHISATSTRSNYEQLTSWVGSVTITEESIKTTLPLMDGKQKMSGPFIQSFESIVDFAWDQSKASFMSEFRMIGSPTYTFAADGRSVDCTAKPTVEASIVTPESFIYLSRSKRYGPLDGYANDPLRALKPGLQSAPVIYLDEPSKSYPDRLYGTVFAAQDMLGITTGVPFQTMFSHLAERGRDQSNSLPLNVEVTGPSDDPSYKVLFANYIGNEQLQFMAVSGSARNAYMPSEFVMYHYGEQPGEDVVPMQVQKWSYDRFGGVLLPSSYSITLHDPGSERPRIHRVVRHRTYSVNEPINGERFSLAALDMPGGTRVLDRRSKKLQILDKTGQLVSPDRYFAVLEHQSARNEPRSIAPRWAAIVLTSIIIGVLGLMICWKRYTATQ